MYCTKCGKELFDEAVFCPNCGVPVVAWNIDETVVEKIQQTECIATGPVKKEKFNIMKIAACFILALALPVAIVFSFNYSQVNSEYMELAELVFECYDEYGTLCFRYDSFNDAVDELTVLEDSMKANKAAMIASYVVTIVAAGFIIYDAVKQKNKNQDGIPQDTVINVAYDMSSISKESNVVANDLTEESVAPIE